MQLRSPLSGIPHGRTSLVVGVLALALSGLEFYVDALAWRRYEHPLGPGYDSALPSAIELAFLGALFAVVGVVLLRRARVPRG